MAVDLAEALRARNQFESRMRTAEGETAALRTRLTRETKLSNALGREKEQLTRKVRDMNEELKGKRKLFDVHHTIPYPKLPELDKLTMLCAVGCSE